MNLTYKKNLLLLGAGFTKNFGGFLASGMWAEIFNNPDLNQFPEIKKLFLNGDNKFDFEKIFSVVMQKNKYQNDKNKFERIVVETFVNMQKIIQRDGEQISDIYGIDKKRMKEFLSLFLFDGDQAGCCFTLNQDLFFEQKFGWQPFIPKTNWFSEDRLKTCGGYKDKYSDSDPNVLPNQNRLNIFLDGELDTELEKIKKQHNILYMKLHGSLGWVAHDGSSRMIIGKNKKEDIEKEPLLNFYFQEFKKALNQEGTKLLVIGYSFNDEHVNDFLVDAINNNRRLKLYIISIESPDVFHKRMTYKYPYFPETLNDIDDNKSKIWNAVDGYFTKKMNEIFPIDGRETDTALTLKKILA